MNDQNVPLDGYTYPEKLMLVSQGLMAPEEIGVATAEEAQALQVMKDPPKQAFLGGYCTFEVSEVPLKLRALWAKQDSKIIPFNDEEWIEANKDTHRLQVRLRCGTVATMLDQTFDSVLGGFVAMLHNAGDLLAKMKETYEKGPVMLKEGKDPLIEQKATITTES